ncbi:DNA cross-link repair 1A protein-like [Petromyzon marinus]|uniref:DNA cross-link repair 1A protein-like n=1 Tax=Petromyzon marinus TaxID=7757 RepID=UPI003F6F7702
MGVATRVGDSKLTLLDANHCPGAAMLLVERLDGRRFLHTGDFRATDAMAELQPLRDGARIHTLYLDNTYCSPEFCFPSQEETVEAVAMLAVEALALDPSTLFVVGSYTVGKEKVIIAVAEVLNCKVAVTPDKLRILRCLDLESLGAQRLTTSWASTQLHVLPMARLTLQGLARHLAGFPGRYGRLVAFKPTGWAYSGTTPRPQTRGNVTIYGIPYSEHSSYSELRQFVRRLAPSRVVPTVMPAPTATRRALARWLGEGPPSPPP